MKAVFEEEHDDREFTTSVHYLKFPLTASAKAFLVNTEADEATLRLVLNHPNGFSEVEVPSDVVSSLRKDLA